MNAKRQRDSENAEKGKKRNKREERAELSALLEDEDVKRGVKEAWSQRAQYSHGDLELDCHPFPHLLIRNFIQGDSFTENLQRELLDLNFHEKSNDLYKFNQSDDLKKRKEPHITGLRAALFGLFRSWLGEVLGVELEPIVDVSCAKYQYTDVLLCHDDELEGRRVAFILYLVPPWESSDGGTLDLFSTDDHFQPHSVVKSLVPSWNTLILFEVSPVSFHQETLLLEWLNPLYLDVDYQSQVQQEFEDSSEIQLKNFLKEEKFKEVSEALRLTDVQWTKQGPPNRRCYEVASLESFPQCVSACWELLCSEAFFLLLSNFTGLRLHYLSPSDEDEEEEKDQEDEEEGEATGSSGDTPSANKNNKEPSTPVCVGELRRWAHGDYTLLHDGDASKAEYALDLLLPLSCPDWQTEFGGFTSYIANEEDEELLMVYPEENSLALVYRDKETLKFVKHINHRSSTLPIGDSCRRAVYDFSFVYYE
ncbi:prolyl 3-hydroxylase OGFOD1 isoform X2 [Oncorhynchus nerka]|uniref:prolyl 3-hydroxylase OGFOD1 isoform X2 n=1 Tax=Oncorhynchus nerka TaxID=8023 RepID=UPI00113163C3|nr:prolyl 3-hydroxylase OGFOD1 isoform X2 [Oncorhynchus nerka]